MITIYKYPIPPIPTVQNIELPRGSEILSVGVDYNNIISFWALVDTTEKETETRKIACVGTGWDMTAVMDLYPSFIGKVQTAENEIYHVFEVI